MLLLFRVPQKSDGHLWQNLSLFDCSQWFQKAWRYFVWRSCWPCHWIGFTAIQALQGVVSRKVGSLFLSMLDQEDVASFGKFKICQGKGLNVYTTTSHQNVDWVKALWWLTVVIRLPKRKITKVHSSGLRRVGVWPRAETIHAGCIPWLFKERWAKLKQVLRVVPVEETAAMMGMEGYKLPENFSNTDWSKNSANYKFTWMQANGELTGCHLGDGERRDKIRPVTWKVYAFKDGIWSLLITLLNGKSQKGKFNYSIFLSFKKVRSHY